MTRQMKVYKVKEYDVRPIDFVTGKRIAVTNEQRETCQCCGKKILKVTELSDGRKVGSECAVFMSMFGFEPAGGLHPSKSLGLSQKQVDFLNTCY